MTTRRAILVVLTLTCASAPALGHGLPPLPLALWGPFAAPTVRCLRHLSEASQRCFNAVLSAERACMDAQLSGASCDQAQRDAIIAAAHDTATAAVDAWCAGGQLVELRYANAADARLDILRACNEADTAARAIYAPALNRVIGPSLTTRDRSCITHVSKLASKLIMANLRDYSRALDGAAALILPPSEKLGRYQSTADRMLDAREGMATHIDGACAGSTVYGDDASAFLSGFEHRSNCVLSTVYFLLQVRCPVPTCGDGIIDTGEECDDGNGIDADGCRADCTLQ